MGLDGPILATTDGGATWSAQSSGSSEKLIGVAFPDATHGWAVGNNGTILATATGGFPPVTTAPSITSFLPVSGPVGTGVTLTGNGFSGATAVTFNAAAATFSVVSATQITATVPVGATTGPIAVTTPAGIGTSSTGFTVTSSAKPRIVKLKPPSAKRGATVAISGTSFGAAQGTSTVRFGSKGCTVYATWSDTQITCQVPTKAKYGAVKVTVTTTVGKSNGKSFKVRR